MTSPTGWGERVPSPAFPVSCKMSFFNGKNDAGWPPLLVHTVCWKSCWILFSQLCLVSIVHVDHHFCDILLQFHKKHWMIYLDGNKMMHLVWDLGKVDSFVVQKWLYIRQTEVVQMPERVGPPKGPPAFERGDVTSGNRPTPVARKNSRTKSHSEKGGFEAVKVRMGW